MCPQASLGVGNKIVVAQIPHREGHVAPEAGVGFAGSPQPSAVLQQGWVDAGKLSRNSVGALPGT